MKIIDLLNKIANGENISNNYMKYFNRQDQKYDICLTCLANLTYKLDNDIIELNDEVEILEEKKIPEKLSQLYASDILDIIGTKYTKTQDKALQNLFEHIRNQDKKINEIIDYLKSKGE